MRRKKIWILTAVIDFSKISAGVDTTLFVRDRILMEVLSEIDESSEIAVSLVCTRDGFPIAFSINSEKSGPDIELLTAMTAVVHATSRKAIDELDAGFHRTSIIEGSKGTCLIKDINDNIIFCCYIPKSKEELGIRVRSYMLGVALSKMETCAKKIRSYLISIELTFKKNS